MIKPVTWDHGELVLLDQTLLPGEERLLRCSTPEQVADGIRRLAVRGAPAIGVAAAYGLALGLRMGRDADEVVELLAGTRPTAVNLRWALEQAHGASADEALETAHRLLREQLNADQRMAELGAELIAAGSRLLTHCNTGALATAGAGTAGGVIDAAWRAGRVAHVWVDETRPLLQGARLTAWELGRAGVPFSVVTDSSVGLLMSRGEVDAVVVGADRIAANGDVANKIGTYTVAVVAERHGVPVYVVAPLSTIDPETAGGHLIPIEERDPAEVTENGPAANFAFDVTPAELVTAIVTEAGVLRPPYGAAISAALARAPARP